MVGLSDNQELEDTKPHRLPDYENETQPIKAVDNSVEQDSQFDTVVAPSVSDARSAVPPERRISYVVPPGQMIGGELFAKEDELVLINSRHEPIRLKKCILFVPVVHMVHSIFP